MTLLAALPMYDYPELHRAHDAWWAAVAARLRASGILAPDGLTHGRSAEAVWSDPGLLLGQGCEYPLGKNHAGAFRHVATPLYTARGCDGPRYRSAILVRRNDPAQTVADLRMRRCVINASDSNSGMNLLRALVAPLSAGAAFFRSVASSGSHRASALMVATGDADVAAVDCVSWALFQRLYPESIAGLRVLDWTGATPSLPLITAVTTGDETLAALRASLVSVAADGSLSEVREQLLLAGYDCADVAGYSEVEDLQRRAAALGYPDLA